MTSRKRNRTPALLATVLGAMLVLGACEDEGDNFDLGPDTVTVTDTVTLTVTDTVTVGTANLVFNQIERLGNPLVSEALLEKRLHGFFNTTNPKTDRSFFRDDIVRFITTVAGRDQAYATTVANALLPDMLMVFPNRAPGVTAANSDGSNLVGWLSHVLRAGTGYGGRKLDNDDAMDTALSVVFGAALGNTNNVSPGLVTDNVPDPQQDPNTFPYVKTPN